MLAQLAGYASRRAMPDFYVDSITGSDSNNGLTAGTAFATLGKAQLAALIAGRARVFVAYGSAFAAQELYIAELPTWSVDHFGTPGNGAATAGGAVFVATMQANPPWLPFGATLHIDTENEHYYWDGQVRAANELGVAANGAVYVDTNFGFAGEATYAIEFAFDEGATLASTMFSWTSGYPSGNRIELVAANGGKAPRQYIAPLSGGGGDFDPISLSSKSGEAGTVAEFGRRRVIGRIANETLFSFQPDNGELRDGGKTVGTLSTPTRVALGGRAWAPGEPDDPFTGGTVYKLTLWNSRLSDAQTQAINKDGKRAPVHLLGDSFLNAYGVFARLVRNGSPSGYQAFSQDGVSSSLTQQAARLSANDPKWPDATLIVLDGGPDGTSGEAITALDSMSATLGHDRWYWMQPAPQTEAGRPAFDQFVQDVLDHIGEDHYIPTLAEAFSRSDGSTEDEEEVAKGLWPLSLKISVTDFHPGALGQQMLADLIYKKLRLMGLA